MPAGRDPVADLRPFWIGVAGRIRVGEGDGELGEVFGRRVEEFGEFGSGRLGAKGPGGGVVGVWREQGGKGYVWKSLDVGGVEGVA